MKRASLRMESGVELVDVGLRLLAATVVGALIGIDREMRGKPLGMRTLALVSLGSALVCVATVHLPVLADEPDSTSRVIQGVIQGVMTGIGFLGAGVVLQRPKQGEVLGLTTAAAVWVAAALGIACGVASWGTVLIGSVLTLIVLIVLNPIDRWLERRAANGDAKASKTE